MARAAAALALLTALVALQLADALRGGGLVGTPAFLLGSAAAGYLVGAAARWPVALGCVVVSAAALTWAHQLDAPGAFPVLDDFVFALVGVGAPALAGLVVQRRAAQVRELQRVAALLEAQREAEVRAARLDERNRLELQLHRDFSEQVAAIAMRAESAVGADEKSTRQALLDVEVAARASLDELREVLGSLREEPEAPATTERVPSHVPAQEPVGQEPVARADLALGAVIGAMVAIESVVSPQAHGPRLLNVVVALLVAAPLVVRRQRPLTACASTLGGFTVMAAWLTPPTAMVTTILPLLVCGYVVGAHVRGRRRALGLAVLAGGQGLLLWADPRGLPEDGGAVPMLGLTVVAVGAGLVSAGWSRRAAELGAAVAELQRGRDVEVALAVAEQRNRLASELHDTVAHAMTVICLQASAGQVRADPGTLDAIRGAARTGLHELRDGLDSLAGSGEPAVAGLTAQARRAGLHPEVRVDGRLDDLPPATQRLAVRVVREALTNAARYAAGSSVLVQLSVGEVLRLSVVDTGPGTSTVDGLGAGSGLSGLAGEVTRSGGTMSWGPSDGGFHVTATLPGAGVLV
jgi:signal transduction histidine kinase